MRSLLHAGFMLTATLLVAAGSGAELAAQRCERACVGPERGAVIATGGGTLEDRIYEEFVRLAGGPSARIVLIPTAGTEDGSHDGWIALEKLRDAGAGELELEVLHTRSRAVADLEAFTAPLEDATGVWISGGRQWRLVDVYLGTATHRALERVLARGGVVAGNSAGASVLASFLLRGGEDNDVVLTDRSEGFGFLRNVAIDQHLLNRGRENEMFHVLRKNPHLLGIGLNEGAALVVTGDLARVLGNSVAIYDVTDPLTLIPLRWLGPGAAYDLGTRRIVLSDANPPGRSPPPRSER